MRNGQFSFTDTNIIIIIKVFIMKAQNLVSRDYSKHKRARTHARTPRTHARTHTLTHTYTHTEAPEHASILTIQNAYLYTNLKRAANRDFLRRMKTASRNGKHDRSIVLGTEI